VAEKINEDTSVAISTPPGEGGIGIVRISGQHALEIVHHVFAGVQGHDRVSVSSHSLWYGHIVHPDTGAIIDEVLLSVMRAPRSYTREDVVEINCHGGMLPLQNILDVVLACGARLATPGEFTKRAFLHGRIDLSQAESVIDIIRAKTNAGLQLAVQQLQGKLSGQITSLRDALTNLLASIEASIDFIEDDIEIISYDRIHAELHASLEQIERLLASAHEGKIVRDGLSIAIVGKPNVGKSSLLNLFLEEERAIVTPIPGTTRDTIEDYINLNGVPMRLIDTAGIRNPADQVERLGVDRSRHMIQQADMALCVFDVSIPWSQEDEDFLDVVKDKKKILVLNKIDLPAQFSVEDVIVKLPQPVPAFSVSVNEHIGFEPLKQAIVRDVMAVPLESVAVTNVRHKHLLSLAQKSLVCAQESTELHMSSEFIALDIREALHHLGEITGETTTEDILETIFSTFCIGK
jgi:tRNA modification GTPase